MPTSAAPLSAVLAYMLARNGVDVTLLEAHHDFDRDFRGDTLHPSTLEVLDELGLADKLLQLPHTKLSNGAVNTPLGSVQTIDFHTLKTKFPYIAFMPQARFLEFITSEAQRFPSFHLRMGARVDELIEENGVVCGVRYQADGATHSLRAVLIVGADGRFSVLRKLSGLGDGAIAASQPLDILWFRLTRNPDEPHGVLGRFGHGHLLVQLERGAQWQIGFVMPKGGYHQIHDAGIEALRQAIAESAPDLRDRLHELSDWKQTSLLSVVADRLPRWHRPGLLLIGDAAHIMSPAGGNGINYAIMDAVATANLLSQSLKAGNISEDDLACVQRRRERPIRIIQTIVNAIQNNVFKAALDPDQPFTPPGFMRWRLTSQLIAQVMGFGIGREHVRD